ncbi:hypothetical protein RRG08_064544 [Elysia crispata]|uniref:Cadherin domain-containing protein n=1 Tax=Elysia crispata TaxID=231223 RepID=A0AAE1B9C0_9GAST|nr:hypothetical protein RRG08_064544 [Elysia crispata]
MDQAVVPLLAIFSVFLTLSSANSPPSWVESSISVFIAGFSEDTKVGAVLGTLECNDTDGDRVGYKLTSGTAVRVNFNGTVTLAVPLDFEKLDRLAYDLTFECVDFSASGRPLRDDWVETRTVISPLDANDNPPEFSVANIDGYSFFVFENKQPGFRLEPPILIKDIDRGRNAVLDKLYIICNSPFPNERIGLTESSRATCETFDISYQQDGEGEYSAYLSVIGELDYETRQVYSSKLIAIDGVSNSAIKLTTTVNIQINVRDAQDLPPIFTNLGSSATVNEAAPVGSTVSNFGVSARDGDFGDKRPVKLTIIEDVLGALELTPALRVNQDEGIYESKLVLKNQLDREAITTAYEFVVKVTELDATTRAETNATATATYSVFVTDTNDNAPTFAKNFYNISVSESQTSQSTQIPAFQIICIDPDEISNAKYRVTVESQSVPIYSVTPGPTFIGSASMFLEVSDGRYLDYDNPQYRTQRIVLVAREEGTPERRSSSTTIQINLRDINDNSPKFTQQSYTLDISEGVKNFPYNFFNITANDVDENENGRVSYRLEGGTEGLFVIDENTGAISLEGPVDYEATPQYVFLVYATDNAVNPRQTQVQITVNILNENDGRPKFLLPVYQTSVNETQRVFLNPVNITAVDNEDGTVGITYRIVSGNSPNQAFVINQRTGVLTLRDSLNYEETPIGDDGEFSGVFELKVEASDNGSPPQTNTVSVLVTVIDVNDHSPVMNPKEYSASISELAPAGEFVVQVMATDDDGGNFGTLFYRIGQGLSDNFFVNPSTGEITVGENREFNYDLQRNYLLQVIASDGGSPQLSATATVSISIEDRNNQPPSFDEFLYYINVNETDPVDVTVKTIQASDKDSTANLEYSILRNSIQASDPDGRSLNSRSTFDYLNAFGVRNQGEIFIQRPLDRALANEVSFTLQVKDLNTEAGTPTATTQVTIIITGKANTNITFDQATKVYMNENAGIGYNVITVTARDPNNNAVTSYEMIQQPSISSSHFDVKANGRITLVDEIDYENDDEADHLHRVVVRAISNDKKQSATVTATISIVDVNDNNPRFTKDVYTTEVPETYVYPMEVVTLFATDDDSTSYGPLDISISGGLDSDDFQIFQGPPFEGSRTSRRAAVIVAPNTKLDYRRRKEYDLRITVVDNVNKDFSNARLSTNARLVIKVIDENNNSPIFVDSARSLAVPETAAIGQSIATLIATDEDGGKNGEISYTLQPKDDDDSGLLLFSINPVTGTVRVFGNLLGKGDETYNMRVRAQDNGIRPNSGYMDLSITVQNTEDDDGNPKWFKPRNREIIKAPEETPGYLLTNGTFFEATARTGNKIQYSLSTLSDSFDSFVISKEGAITIVDTLDREQQEFYKLLVYAEDTLNATVLRTGRQVVVQLTDKDDNEPTFTNPKNYAQCQEIDQSLTLRVSENTPVNTTVYTLSACDPDNDDNSAVQYELDNTHLSCKEENTESILGLNSLTGDLFIKRSMDHEQQKEYGLCVKVMPANTFGNREKRSLQVPEDSKENNVAYITLVVVDENDNGPKFPEKELTSVVLTQPGTGPVMILEATDPDSAPYNKISYRVTKSEFITKFGESQASADVFILREDSGALYPALPTYQSFSGGRFVLQVQASDGHNAKFTDYVQITIYVYEEGQAVKFILGDEPSDAMTYSRDMIKELNGVSRDYSFTLLQLSEHRTSDGIETSKTDLCFLAVDKDDNTILNIRQVINVLNEREYQSALPQTKYNIVDRGQCYPQESSEKDVRWRDLWWVLVAVAIFIFICCIILIVLVVLLYRRYRRYMESRQSYLVSQ